jgi:carotenoid cleavage dioxygenase
MQFEEAPLFPHLDGSPADPAKANARLCEWVLDLGDNANSVKRRYLDDISGEFPRLDERFAGQDYRHGYYAASSSNDGGLGFDSLVHHDFSKGEKETFTLPEGDRAGEPVFVPRSEKAEEGDGYLLSTIYRARENRSDLAIFDTADLPGGPIACAQLPHRVPYGFHGNWKYND